MAAMKDIKWVAGSEKLKEAMLESLTVDMTE